MRSASLEHARTLLDRARSVYHDDAEALAQIEALRKKGIHSFGSCSFDEPIADLQKLGIL